MSRHSNKSILSSSSEDEDNNEPQLSINQKLPFQSAIADDDVISNDCNTDTSSLNSSLSTPRNGDTSLSKRTHSSTPRQKVLDRSNGMTYYVYISCS